ncbi:MAG: rRNA maturation RNase YbeY [Marivibrio sp.]|uniref:rRNA maturation RNase YbeY n=1 Tax=Marivibrio sp. TaxID=2039719 RepID=UPI0032ECBF19
MTPAPAPAPDAAAPIAPLEADVLPESDGWPDWAVAVVKAAAAAAYADAALADPPPPAQVAVLLADDAALRRLNREYRGQDAPTNVLSFPNDDEPPDGEPLFLGDMALAWETLAREAAAMGKSDRDHATHLVVHGMLHLMGMDHEDDDEAAEMEALEIEILARRFGIENPYEEETA